MASTGALRVGRKDVMTAAMAISVVVGGACVSLTPQQPETPAPVQTVKPAATVDAATPAPAKPLIAKRANELVEDMHALYSGIWYSSKTMRQHNTLYAASGREIPSEWIQRISVPGKARIDFLPAADRSGMLITGDSITTFTAGKRTSTTRAVNPMLLFTVDVYVLPLQTTLQRLRTLGVNLTRTRTDSWEGHPVFVVGAASAKDTVSPQFWVDAERMVVVRWVRSEGKGSSAIRVDTHIGKYQDMHGVPIPLEVLTLHNGRPYFREEYSDVVLDASLPGLLFEAKHWGAAGVP